MQHLYNVLRILEKLRREWDTQAHGHTGSMEGEGTVLRRNNISMHTDAATIEFGHQKT